MRISRLAIAALGMFASTSLAAAEAPTKHVRNVSGWDLRIDPSLGDSCFIERPVSETTGMRLTFDMSSGDIFMMAGNHLWRSLEEGKSYEVDIRFDAREPWSATAKAIRTQNGTPALVYRVGSEYIEEMARSHYMRLSWAGRDLGVLNLSGSYDAILAMIDCQKSENAKKDPFATPSAPPPVFVPPPVKRSPPRSFDPFEV